MWPGFPLPLTPQTPTTSVPDATKKHVRRSSSGHKLTALSRVEERRGHRLAVPFPLPAHQTGRAGFPHPAFRLASSQGTRRRAKMDTPEVKHPKRAEYRLMVEAVGAARWHRMTPNQEVTDSVVDVVVDRTGRPHPRGMAQTSGPAARGG